MIIDTKKSTIRTQMQKLILLLLLVSFLVVLYATDYFEDPVMGIERNQLAFIATLIYAIYYSMTYVRDLAYFYFNSDSSKIIVRYYSLKPLSSEQNSIEVNKQDFYKFEINAPYGGLRNYLTIYQRTNKGIAKYPPVSISILKKKDVEQLTRELSSIR